MADIKTRDAVKGTIKTIDKAAIASERMKAAYAKTKDKAEQGYYVDESSATEYASDKITELYMSLNKLAYDNVFPNEKGYNSNSTPCALYYKNGIGLYPYFAIGECVHLCIIPVTQETISDFEARGVKIYEIE